MSDAAQENTLPVFSIEKIYVKDISLEIPHAPKIFLERDNPQIDVQLHTLAESLEKGLFEVVVTATVTARMGEKVMFLIEVKQAGVFQAHNVPGNELEQVLAVICPNTLFPFLRESVSDVSMRAGFAPVLLNPINFETLFQRQKIEAQAAATATTH